MTRKVNCFEQMNAIVSHANALREEAISDAFAALCIQKPSLSQTLVEQLGDCNKAARWMSQRHRAFDSRNAYEVLAEGDEDLVWDALERSVPVDSNS